MKLISMTDFVLGTESDLDKHNPVGLKENIEKRYSNILKYANFLKQPLKLEMFVPCDDNGSVLENPICQLELEQYRKAKEKVLFKGFTYNSEDELVERGEIDGSFWSIDIDEIVKYTIEDMVQCDIILTQNAIKQFM